MLNMEIIEICSDSHTKVYLQSIGRSYNG